MVKKFVAALVAVVVLLAVGAVVWARSILATETVRSAIASQIASAIGQPVAIGGIGASIFPRVTIDLDNVTIGQPPRIQVETLHVATGFRALLSRRVEHAALRLTKARVQLPLPDFGEGGADAPQTSEATGGSAVEIISVDEIVLSDVEIVSGSRTLHGDIEASIEGKRVIVRSVELEADDTAITASGEITDMTAPAGQLAIKADTLNVDRLIAFASDFAGGAAAPSAPKSTTRPTGR
jgi:uncharacterized protein involved in outer membrane biogenesis